MRHSKVSYLEIDEIEVILVSEMKRHFYKNFDYFHETSHENFKVSIVKINTVLTKKGEDKFKESIELSRIFGNGLYERIQVSF